MKQKRFTTGLWLLFWLIGWNLAAQQSFTLSGVVKDQEGQPLPIATVAVQNQPLGTYTDPSGHYALKLPPGTYRITASMVGYTSEEQEITVKGNARLHFTLRENAVHLESVTVTGKSKEQKLREGAYAINAVDIKSLSATINSLNDVVNRTTGIRIREEGGVGSDFDLSINGLSGNAIRYFLDGMPLDTKGAGVTLANLPVQLIDHIEIYKGVIPASLGADALGGAINIITRRQTRNYLDLSYGVGSFHTHKAGLNAQYADAKSGLIVKPVLQVSYSKNDYLMKDVEVRNADKSGFITTDCKRFHDDYLSLYGQIEAGVAHKPWADALFVSASCSRTDKELQTGSVQSWVYGMAERNTRSYNLSARYEKSGLLVRDLSLQAVFSQTWDHSETIDTTYRKYYWDGTYINGSFSEIRGRGRTWRHYRRPMTMARANLEYRFNEQHALSVNYLLNRTGNKQEDDVDEDYIPTRDVLLKHIAGLSYNQELFHGKMQNVFFLKEYINHLSVEQTELGSITGANEVKPEDTQSYLGGGFGTRFTQADWLSVKASYEHSVRLPLSYELLGNGSTIYPNVGLRPECSDNLNVGLFGTLRLAPHHVLYYEGGGFLRLVDDYIQAFVSEQEGMMQYENVEAVHIKGVEGEIRYNWSDRLQLSANASFQDSRDQQQYKKDGKPSVTYKNRTPNKPWSFVNAEAAYTFHQVGRPDGQLRIAFHHQWVHWFYLTWEAYGSAKTKARVPTQNISNASLFYSWERGRYSISVECTNLFDRLAYDNYMLQKPGRAFFAKFRLFIQ